MGSASESTRPASILSPHGEGYCRHCRFIIGLDADGFMDRHWYNRGVHTDDSKPCKGSFRRPAVDTPYRSNLSIFKATPQYEACPVCGDSTLIQYDSMFAQHIAKSNKYEYCRGSFTRYVRPER